MDPGLSGPGRLVGADRGVRVPIGPKGRLVEGSARAPSTLVADPGRARSLGASARDHAPAHDTRDAKARKAVEVDRWVLGRRAEEPTFD